KPRFDAPLILLAPQRERCFAQRNSDVHNPKRVSKYDHRFRAVRFRLRDQELAYRGRRLSDYRWNSTFEDSSFFSRDRFESVAEQIRVVEANRRDHAA